MDGEKQRKSQLLHHCQNRTIVENIQKLKQLPQTEILASKKFPTIWLNFILANWVTLHYNVYIKIGWNQLLLKLATSSSEN